MADNEDEYVDAYYPPAIDDLFQINGEILRTQGVHTWEDKDEQIIVLTITLSRTEFHIIEKDIPDVFRNAFKEE